MTTSLGMTPPHLVSVASMSADQVDSLITDATQLVDAGLAAEFPRLDGLIVATLFFQPSTRTRLSFESAAMRLGARCLSCADGATLRAGSAWQESLADTARVVNAYADIVVLRHPAANAASEYAAMSKIPVINAGDGTEHPTQALADVMTLWRELGRLDHLRLMLVGDLDQRCARSLLLALSLYGRVRVLVVPHPGSDLDPGLAKKLVDRGLLIDYGTSISAHLEQVDAVYMVGMNDPAKQPLPRYCLDPMALTRCKRVPIILHPLPRGPEVPKALDGSSSAAYFRQAANAVALRMALIKRMVATPTRRLDMAPPEGAPKLHS
ncbi:hypothetical protein [Roseateles sp.]|uniref:aspartate/ornithine carbamoyltransferase family protein n=1 Tax=Roseateles sp. TaxID=1971397 RepID=UPI0031D4D177